MLDWPQVDATHVLTPILPWIAPFHCRRQEPGLADTSAAPKCRRETLPSETCVTGRTGRDKPPLDQAWRGKGHQQYKRRQAQDDTETERRSSIWPQQSQRAVAH